MTEPLVWHSVTCEDCKEVFETLDPEETLCYDCLCQRKAMDFPDWDEVSI